MFFTAREEPNREIFNEITVLNGNYAALKNGKI